MHVRAAAKKYSCGFTLLITLAGCTAPSGEWGVGDFFQEFAEYAVSPAGQAQLDQALDNINDQQYAGAVAFQQDLIATERRNAEVRRKKERLARRIQQQDSARLAGETSSGFSNRELEIAPYQIANDAQSQGSANNVQLSQSNCENVRSFAVCAQNRSNRWECAGPVQFLWSAEKTLTRALEMVGCEDGTRISAIESNRFALNVGYVYVCPRPKMSYDIDIINEFNLDGLSYCGDMGTVINQASGNQPGTASQPVSPSPTNNFPRSAGWYGYFNSPNKDRDSELRYYVGSFSRISADGTFNELCRSISRECRRVIDWEGESQPCHENLYDGSRVAYCQ